MHAPSFPFGGDGSGSLPLDALLANAHWEISGTIEDDLPTMDDIDYDELKKYEDTSTSKNVTFDFDFLQPLSAQDARRMHICDQPVTKRDRLMVANTRKLKCGVCGDFVDAIGGTGGTTTSVYRRTYYCRNTCNQVYDFNPDTGVWTPNNNVKKPGGANVRKPGGYDCKYCGKRKRGHTCTNPDGVQHVSTSLPSVPHLDSMPQLSAVPPSASASPSAKKKKVQFADAVPAGPLAVHSTVPSSPTTALYSSPSDTTSSHLQEAETAVRDALGPMLKTTSSQSLSIQTEVFYDLGQPKAPVTYPRLAQIPFYNTAHFPELQKPRQGFLALLYLPGEFCNMHEAYIHMQNNKIATGIVYALGTYYVAHGNAHISDVNSRFGIFWPRTTYIDYVNTTPADARIPSYFQKRDGALPCWTHLGKTHTGIEVCAKCTRVGPCKPDPNDNGLRVCIPTEERPYSCHSVLTPDMYKKQGYLSLRQWACEGCMKTFGMVRYNMAEGFMADTGLGLDDICDPNGNPNPELEGYKYMRCHACCHLLEQKVLPVVVNDTPLKESASKKFFAVRGWSDKRKTGISDVYEISWLYVDQEWQRHDDTFIYGYHEGPNPSKFGCECDLTEKSSKCSCGAFELATEKFFKKGANALGITLEYVFAYKIEDGVASDAYDGDDDEVVNEADTFHQNRRCAKSSSCTREYNHRGRCNHKLLSGPVVQTIDDDDDDMDGYILDGDDDVEEPANVESVKKFNCKKCGGIKPAKCYPCGILCVPRTSTSAYDGHASEQTDRECTFCNKTNIKWTCNSCSLHTCEACVSAFDMSYIGDAVMCHSCEEPCVKV